jgi:hypothetical protein
MCRLSALCFLLPFTACHYPYPAAAAGGAPLGAKQPGCFRLSLFFLPAPDGEKIALPCTTAPVLCPPCLYANELKKITVAACLPGRAVAAAGRSFISFRWRQRFLYTGCAPSRCLAGGHLALGLFLYKRSGDRTRITTLLGSLNMVFSMVHWPCLKYHGVARCLGGWITAGRANLADVSAWLQDPAGSPVCA